MIYLFTSSFHCCTDPSTILIMMLKFNQVMKEWLSELAISPCTCSVGLRLVTSTMVPQTEVPPFVDVFCVHFPGIVLSEEVWQDQASAQILVGVRDEIGDVRCEPTMVAVRATPDNQLANVLNTILQVGHNHF